MTIYYVYAYIRKSNFTPYYIGKGKGQRAWTKSVGEVGKPTDSKRIIIVENNLKLVPKMATKVVPPAGL